MPRLKQVQSSIDQMRVNAPPGTCFFLRHGSALMYTQTAFRELSTRTSYSYCHSSACDLQRSTVSLSQDSHCVVANFGLAQSRLEASRNQEIQIVHRKRHDAQMTGLESARKWFGFTAGNISITAAASAVSREDHNKTLLIFNYLPF